MIPATLINFLLLVSIGPIVVSGWNIALSIITNPGGAFGGSEFVTQPVVAVNNKRGELQRSIQGRITVQVESFPNSVYEPVWKEGESIPTEASRTFVSESVKDGLAIFSGLGIDTAGEGYRLKFVFYDEHELLMGTAVSEKFTVDVGEIYQLGIVTQPESAYGGIAFGSQPVVGIQDRGGNIVKDVNIGTVRCTTHYSLMVELFVACASLCFTLSFFRCRWNFIIARAVQLCDAWIWLV